MSGVHHIAHNVEQKKGVHCLFSAMASGNAYIVVMESSSNSYLVARTKKSRPGPSSARAVQEMGRAAGALGKIEAGRSHQQLAASAVFTLQYNCWISRMLLSTRISTSTLLILSPAGVVTKKMLNLGVYVWCSLRSTWFSTFTGHNNGIGNKCHYLH